MLTSPLHKAKHDEHLEAQSWTGAIARIQPQKIFRATHGIVDNFLSRMLLLKKRVSSGEMSQEVEEIRTLVRRGTKSIERKIRHFLLLPAITDRLHLASEMVFQWRTLLAAVCFVLFIS